MFNDEVLVIIDFIEPKTTQQMKISVKAHLQDALRWAENNDIASGNDALLLRLQM